jgi:ribulose-5-phosphate 4-epimerase/fuculose-1-phosphate aldolase
MLTFDHIHNIENCKMEKYNKVIKLDNFKPKEKNLNEQDLRIQLAAAYRIFHHLKWDYLIYGHITVRVPGPEKHFLINPFGLRYDEVTASNLVKVDLKGNIVEESKNPVNPAGFVIHSAIHSSREDAHCVMHTHTPAGMAAAGLKNPIKNIDFDSAALTERIAYHDFEGVTIREEECERLSNNLGDKSVMILRNHGLLSVGTTIPHAFIRLHTLERACQVQMLTRSINEDLIEVSDNIAKAHANEIENSDRGELAFNAMMRLMEKVDPSFKN